jgi:hypothetical protein
MPSPPRPPKEFDVGVLFVHGIGTQRRGQTLAESGGPLFRWLRDRCEGLARRQLPSDRAAEELRRWRQRLQDAEWSLAGTPGVAPPSVVTPGSTADSDALLRRVVLHDTQFHDPGDAAAPAHARMTILSLERDERVTGDRWLLGESWWADAFASPTYAELARWGIGILPWIVGSHFAAQVERRYRERPPRPLHTAGQDGKTASDRDIWAISLWLWRLVAAIGGLGVGLLSTALTIPLLLVVLAVGALPIPMVRRALLALQLKMAATLGDCYVLLARPIEAASIVSQIRRDMVWMAARCSEVVIVAHSQGGAVAHLALRGTNPDELKLLFTFGSGLRKLEEARELMKSGRSFALSALLTAIALVVILLCTSLLASLAFADVQARALSVLLVVLFEIGAVALLIAGLRDHFRGIPLADLDRWIERMRLRGPRWVDCFASADPVPNGTIAADAEGLSREVCNASSMVADHTSYWTNVDEFLSVLYGEIAASRARDPLPDLRLGDTALRQIARRRRWRVAIGRTIQWVGAAGLLAVVTRHWPAWQTVPVWGWARGGAWLSDVFALQPAPARSFALDWPALGFLVLLLVPYWIVRRVWRSANESEMQEALGLELRGPFGPTIGALWLLALLVSGLSLGQFPPLWLFFLLLLATMVFIINEPRDGTHARGDGATMPSTEPAAAPQTSGAEHLVSAVIGVGMIAAAPFSMVLSLWEGVIWLTGRLAGGTILGFNPAEIPSIAAGAVAAVLFLAVWGLRVLWTKRPPAAS